MLNRVLEKKNITLYTLAKGAGIPYSTLSDLKNGKVSAERISAGNLYRMSTFLGMTMDQLYEELNTKDPLYLKTQKDFPVSMRLRNKVLKLRIQIPEYQAEGRFVLKDDKWMLHFSYLEKEYEIPFDGIVSNEKFPLLETVAAFLIENFLINENFKNFANEALEE